MLSIGDGMEEKLKEIILDNRNLIYSVIHRFRGSDYDDLYQAGCLGLIKAYQSFRQELNVKFTTYAYPFIVGEIYQFINNNRSIHMSPMNIRLLNSIKKAEDVLTVNLGRSPTDNELASFLEIDLLKLGEIRNLEKVESLDYGFNSMEYDAFSFMPSISNDSLIDLKEAIKSLNEEEQKIILARFYYNYTQGELAKLFHTNQVKISRDEKKILCKLKAKMY